jgi:shikimate dehydrogenase
MERGENMKKLKYLIAGLLAAALLLGAAPFVLAGHYNDASVSMLVLDYACDLPLLQILNSNNIGIAVMQGVSGSFGVVMCIPLTAAIAAFIYMRGKKPALDIPGGGDYNVGIQTKREEAMKNACYRKDYIACFGDPIDENPTVVIMEPAFEKLGLNCIYNGALVRKDDLCDAVRAIKALHMLGVNVTVPHKVAVMQYLDHVEQDAQLIGAVNTIYLKDGETWGANTDGKGFLTALRESGYDPAGKKAVLFGAGGAARAIAVELALAKCASILVVNRTPEHGQALAAHICEKTGAAGKYAPWTPKFTVPADADLVVNATNIGLYPDQSCPDLDFDSLLPHMLVCDVIPNPPRTAFLEAAAKRGCKTLDGLSMLVNQGVIGLKIWTGRDAPKEAMKAALAKEFSAQKD